MSLLKTLVIDTETNGMEDDSEIVEFGAAPVLLPKVPEAELPMRGEIQVGSGRSTLIKPIDPKMPPEVMAVHHITPEMLEDSPFAADGVRKVCNSFGFEPDYYVAHNSRFDDKYLKGLLAADGPWIDTYRVALVLFPEAPSHKNAALFYWLNLHRSTDNDWPAFFETSQLHRALPDSVITAHLFKDMLTRMPVSKMVEISSRPALLPKVAFGKHRGKKWSEVDLGYIKWILNQDFDEDVMHTASQELVNRQ